MSILFYDKNCNFCLKIVSKIKSYSKVTLELRTLQSITANDYYFSDFNLSEINSAMWVFDKSTNQLYRGYFAFKLIINNYLNSIFLKLIFNMPLNEFFGVRVYKVISLNRRFAGCDSNNCSIHAKK